MAEIVLGAFRSASPPPEEPEPVSLGSTWIMLGDSQTEGYGTGTTQNPPSAIRAIYDLDYTAPTTYVRNGVGGRALAATDAYYGTRDERTSATLVYFQESGDQNETGQTTAEEFGDSFDAFISEIIANTPNAVIVTETAFSFGREATQYRNWDAYNTELRARVAAWVALGTTIYISEVDRNIKDLQAALTPGDVWFQENESNSYHYKDTGNLMVALSFLDALNYPVASMDLSGITNVSTDHKNACLAVIASYQ